MKPKSFLLFAVAAGCGLVAMVGAQQLLSARGKGVEKVRVLVARAEINPGVRLNQDLVGFREIPKDAVPEGAVVEEKQYEDRALKARAFPGQVIQVAQLGEKGQFGTSLDIPAGMRLVTVPASSTMIHSGIMKPGDRVDVVLTYKMLKKGSGQQTLAKTILEYIQVYAMGDQRMGSEAAEAGVSAKDVKNVTLLVSPIQAEIMKLAESKGDLHLTLRSTLDMEAVASKGTDESKLETLRAELSELGVDPPADDKVPPPEPVKEDKPSFIEYVQAEPEPIEEPVAETPEPPKWKVEVFQGDERKVFEVDVPPAASRTTTQEQPQAESQVTANPGFWKLPLARWMAGQRQDEAKPATVSQ